MSCLAFGLSFLPPDAKTTLHTNGMLHPWLHFGLFSVLGSLGVMSSGKTRTRLLLVVAAAMLGLLMEYTEDWSYHGGLEVYDMVTDAGGVVFGAIGGWFASRRTY